MIYIFKYEGYEKQTNFLRNTRKVVDRVGGIDYEENN